MYRIIALCVFALTLSSSFALAEPSKEAVKKLAVKVKDATLAGDYAKVVDFTFPGVVQQAGGKEKMTDFLEKTMKQMQDQGIAIKKYVIGQPGSFHTEAGNTFIVIPSSMELSIPGGRIVQESYLLGISSDQGKSWSFIDGAGLQRDNQDFRQKVLPKMPADLKLPKTEKPQVIRE